MAEFIYQMYQARKAHGDKVILDDVTLSFYPGAKIGVVGPNGMGKSTLLKIMAGIEEVSNGDARLTPGYTVGILQQEPPLDDDKTVIENVRMAFGDMIAKVDRFNKIGEEMCDPDCDMDALMAEMGKLQDEIDAADGWDIDSKLGQAMDALQLPDSDMPVNVLSGGERRRVALCKLLLEAPDLLLLDEPTNHLDAESILWLEHFLHNYQGAVLAVTHDRYFLDNVAEWICEVDRGHLYPYKGNYSTYLETKAKRLEAQGQQQAKLAKRMEAELEWVRSSPKARQAKNKARLARYEEMEAEARASQKLDWTDIRIPVGPRLGNKVLEAHHLHKEFDGRVLIDDLSFTLPRNGIVGVIGPNDRGFHTHIGCAFDRDLAEVDCVSCGQCIVACPTGALTEQGCEVTHCLSDLTQRKGPLPPEAAEQVRRSPTVWGCDLCQKACPHNQAAALTPLPEFRENLLCSLTLAELEPLSNKAFRRQYARRAFSWRGIGPLRRNLALKEEAAPAEEEDRPSS